MNEFRVGKYVFSVEHATFRYVSESISGPGWDFSFSGKCVNDDPENPIFPYGFRLFTEAAPLPIQKASNYEGVSIEVEPPFDEDSGEPYFGLNVLEEHEVSGLLLRFGERKGGRYLIEIKALAAESLLGHIEPLRLSAWTEELPDHAYPT